MNKTEFDSLQTEIADHSDFFIIPGKRRIGAEIFFDKAPYSGVFSHPVTGRDNGRAAFTVIHRVKLGNNSFRHCKGKIARRKITLGEI